MISQNILLSGATVGVPTLLYYLYAREQKSTWQLFLDHLQELFGVIDDALEKIAMVLFELIGSAT